jgi:hypothetical protein
MPHPVELKSLPAQPIEAVRGRATMATLPTDIRALFDKLYAVPKPGRGLNIVLYPGSVDGEFEIACGVLVELGGNAATPAGTVATTVHIGPYNQMKPAHQAIHKWVRDNNRRLAGPSWEVYGHWTDDPASLRTDIFYLLV